ncbi:MAG: hypothetical protein KDA21_09565 [Phycisphaerales bacterium]|nr:hypothetical protein [Phycisphaerales bacterium]
MRAAALTEYASELAGFTRVPSDTCVVWDSGRPLTRVMCSINATTGDLLLAREQGCDGYLLHHPLAGAARRDFHHVLDRMVELMTMHGVPEAKAIEAQQALRRRLRFNDHASDWDHLASAAAHTGVTLVNVHLPADELGRLVMVEALRDLKADATLDDARRALCRIPELAHPANEVLLVPDDPPRPAGRIAVMHAGGTNGGASVATCLLEEAVPRVDTVLYIHVAGEDAARIEERGAGPDRGSVIVTGHFASDAIGMNILIAALESRGLTLIRHGGLRPFAEHATTRRPG